MSIVTKLDMKKLLVIICAISTILFGYLNVDRLRIFSDSNSEVCRKAFSFRWSELKYIISHIPNSDGVLRYAVTKRVNQFGLKYNLWLFYSEKFIYIEYSSLVGLKKYSLDLTRDEYFDHFDWNGLSGTYILQDAAFDTGCELLRVSNEGLNSFSGSREELQNINPAAARKITEQLSLVSNNLIMNELTVKSNYQSYPQLLNPDEMSISEFSGDMMENIFLELENYKSENPD